jgi:predicted Zn-dependent protease
MEYPRRVRRAVLVVSWAIVATAFVFVGSAFGGAGIALGVALVLALWVWQWLWLPRAASSSFAAGRHASAARRYRLAGVLAAAPQRRRAALLSRIACHVAAGEDAIARRLMASIASDALDVAERAVWVNNTACLALARGEATAALALADEATALRPDVPALQHTRGMALLAVGRVDDAIAVLDQMRAGGELAARLEAERCRDLARAWTQKGEAAYAEDYRLRAEALSPSTAASSPSASATGGTSYAR